MTEHFYFFVFCFFILGSIFGSFANVCIVRLPKGKSLLGRSKCPNCKSLIPWNLNIPILSYILLKGKCHACRNLISKQYFIVECISAFGFASLYFVYELQLVTFLLLLLFLIYLIIFFIDLNHYIIPNELNYILIFLGLAKNFIPDLDFYQFPSTTSSMIGSILGYVLIWFIIQVYYLLRKKEGMGFGDAKLLAAIGAWFGVFSLPFILFFSSVVALIYVTPSLVRKKRRLQSAIPFGPFLIIGNIIYFVFQNQIAVLFKI